MKRVLLIASIIGLFMAFTLDLQAYHRRNSRPQHRRGGIGFTLHRSAPLFNHLNRYSRYNDRQDRHAAREIRRNEKRIWKLERKINRLERCGGSYRKISRLEQEINWLQRRNEYLRNQLY
jgi:hypothetical protein